MGLVGIEPTWSIDRQIFLPLWLSPPCVCGLDYAFIRSGCQPSSLYTFTFLRLARRWDFKPFTEFDWIHLNIPT
jgi:hypothetical protein